MWHTLISNFHWEKNMSITSGSGLARRHWIRLLPCLLGGVMPAHAADTVGAQQTQAAAAAPLRHSPAIAGSYRVINLGAGELSSGPEINDRGQVAYALDTGQVLFYDGANIVPIGLLPGPQGGSLGLNNLGQVAGSYLLPDGFNGRGFVWSQAGGVTFLPTLGGNSGFAYAINDRGQVAGNANASSGIRHAYRWSPTTGIEDIGLFPGGFSPAFTTATAINDSGTVVGWGSNENGDGHGFVWTRKTGLIDLGTLGGTYSIAQGINAAGQVIGASSLPGNVHAHAFIWTPGRGLLDLGPSPDVDSGGNINDKGQVAGTISFSTTRQHAFFWTRTRGMVDLGTLGGLNSGVLDLNDKGQVVGGANTRQGAYHAFVWTAKEGMVDLNKRLRYAPAGLVVDIAAAISNNGSIVATSNAGLVLLTPDCGCPGTHAVGPIEAPDMVEVGAMVDGTVGFAGADTVARHNVTWSWGDDSGEQAGHARESGGAGSAAGSHTYAAPGVYTISATVTDLGGRSATVTRRIVAYEKGVGGVRGSGRFLSPQGANRQARTQSGMAVFDLVAASPNGSKTAAARATLQFRTGTLNFSSRTLKPVAARGPLAQFEGSGTINGAGDYQFALSTTAGASDAGRFGLKIWHLDPMTRAEVVDYDNLSAGPGATGPAVQGSIVHQ